MQYMKETPKFSLQGFFYLSYFLQRHSRQTPQSPVSHQLLVEYKKKVILSAVNDGRIVEMYTFPAWIPKRHIQ